MKHSESIIKLSEAICKAQKNFKTAVKNRVNPYYHSKYADYTEILSCVKEPLNKEGISILQPIHDDVVETVLLHESGEYISSITKIYNVSNKPQDYGSAITYARRYALSAILSIDADDDDDGNRANDLQSQPRKPISLDPKERMNKIKKLLSDLLTTKRFETVEQLQGYLGMSLTEIPNRLDEAEKKLMTFLKGEKK